MLDDKAGKTPHATV